MYLELKCRVFRGPSACQVDLLFILILVLSSLEFMSEKNYSFSYEMAQEALNSRNSTISGSHATNYLLKDILIFFSNPEWTSVRPAERVKKKKSALQKSFIEPLI